MTPRVRRAAVRALCVTSVCFLLAACGVGDDGEADTAPTDAATADAARADGPPDGAAPPDMGPADAHPPDMAADDDPGDMIADGASEDMAPVDMTPVDMTPVDMTPVDMAPIDMAPVDLAPDAEPVDMAPDAEPVDMTPDAEPVDMAPADMAVDAEPDMAPEDMAPEDMAPEDMAPEDMAPEDMAPEDMAPEDMAPEDMAPEDAAVPDPVEQCDNGRDDDRDGLVDCADDDCDCGPCPRDDRFEDSSDRPFQTYLDRGRFSGLASCDFDIYHFVLCAGGRAEVTARFEHASGDLDLLLGDSSNGAIVDTSRSRTDGERVSHTHDGPADIRMDVIVDHAGVPYTLEIDLQGCSTDERCVDGLDFDGDGLTGCDDPDCAGRPACQDGLCNRDDLLEPSGRDPAPFIAPGRYDGLQLCDADNYTFQICPGGTATIETHFDPARHAIALWAFAPDLEPIAGDAHPGGARARVHNASADEMPAEIVLSDAIGAPYALDLRVDGCPGAELCDNRDDDDHDDLIDCADPDCAADPRCAPGTCPEDDRYEDASDGPPDDPRAPRLMRGLTAGLALCDPDTYAFSLCSGGTARLTVGFRHDEGDIDALLFADRRVVADGASRDDDEVLVFTNEEGRALDMTLHLYPDTGSAYTVDLAIDGCPLPHERCGNGLDDDEDGRVDCADLACAGLAECVPPRCPEDDRFEDASDRLPPEVELPRGRTSHLALCDQDAYAFTLCPFGTAIVTVDFDQIDGDIDVLLIDESIGRVVGEGRSRDDDEVLVYENQDAGDVRMAVLLEQPTDSTYAIEIDFTGCPEPERCDGGLDEDEDGQIDCADFDCELDPACLPVTCPEDDRFEDASDFPAPGPELPPGRTERLALCDVDIYQFRLCAGGVATVIVEFRHAEGDIDALLFDATAGELAAEGRSATDDEVMVYRNTTGEDAQMDLLLDRPTGSTYAIELQVRGCSP